MNFLAINIRGASDLRKAIWVKGLKSTHGINFLAIQESKLDVNSGSRLNMFWGRSTFAMEQVFAEGRAGGLICMWNPSILLKVGVLKNRHFLIILGVMVATGDPINIANIHAPNDPGSRRRLWADLIQIKEAYAGMWVMLGDFNDVRCPEERRNSEFVPLNAWHFNSFIQIADLYEYNMGGHKFTYMSDSGLKLSKLDRYLVCNGFRSRWPTASVTALARHASDHCPIILKSVANDFGHIPFRFFNSWLEMPGFVNFVDDICRSFSFHGPADLALATKLKYLKNRIKSWVFIEKNKMVGEYNKIKEGLVNLEEVAESRSLSSAEVEKRAEYKERVLEFDRLNLLDIQQKARVRWAIEGDENSSFFHGVMNANTANSRINGLMVDDEWVTSPTVIKDLAFDFFSRKFNEPIAVRPSFRCPNLARLSDTDAEFLSQPFSIIEIKSAVWECGSDKAPGPDGFNFKFIKRFWNHFKNDFASLFEEFHHTGSINQGCSSSFISLIPKANDPKSFSDFRPISLVGCINKVLAKVLANRLKGVIGKLVSEEQTAFLAGRSILDGPLMLNETFGWLKRSKLNGFFFKVDLEKAYDSVSWGFIDSILEQMSFPIRWRRWISAIVSSASASVLINGSPSQEFKCFRGLRQGDPISPFLFVIAMEVLTGMVKQASSIGLFRGLPCTALGPTLNHLIYADDVVFMGEWSRANLENLKRILRCFYLISGLKVNMTKCQLFGIGVNVEEAIAMADLVRCRVGEFPFKFLGLQVGANMNLSKFWEPVLDTVRSRLSAWKAKNLSFGGRVTLIRSVLNSIPTYYFSLYRAPVKVIEAIDRIRRSFFWGGSMEQAKTNWVLWERVIAPVKYGGLGLGSLRDMNMAMLAKWWWRFKCESSSLWRRVVWAIHHNSRAWNFVPAKISIAGPWKQIAKSVSDLLTFEVDLASSIRGVVGNGSTILFWLDRWCVEEPLARRFPSLFLLDKDKFCSVSDRVKINELGVVWAWDWKRSPTNGIESNEWAAIRQVLGVPTLRVGADSWAWDLDCNGMFSVSSIKRVIQESRFTIPEYKFRWNSWIPKKVLIMAWRAELDRLPTRVNLLRRNIIVESVMCPICGDIPETPDHIFAACGFAQMVWTFVSQWCGIPEIYAFGLRDLLELDAVISGSAKFKKAFQAVCLTSLWCIWKARNQVIFEHKSPSLQKTTGDIKALSHLWVKSRSKQSGLEWNVWCRFNLCKVGW